MKLSSAILSVLIAAFAGGCGYVKSGTWADSPKNWKRAFRSTKPPDVVVVHSYYWRSPHWSYEIEYFFQIKSNAALQHQLLTANDLLRVDTNNAEQYPLRSSKKPEWFIPKSTDSYECWVYRTDSNSNFRVFIDKTTRDLFLTDEQL
jgi:hypothetical protein